MREVYITRVSSFLPNRVVENDNMEQYLGLIGDKPSRTRSIVLRQNGIKKRYYALNEKQQITHSNAQLAKEAVVKLFVDNKIPKEISLLSCATSTPDQWIPSHASMVHGELENFPMEIFSSAGVCLTSLQALKICYSNILAGLHMKNHHFLSKLAAIMIAAMFSNASYAQITYSQGKLTIGDVTPHKFLGMTIGGMAGTYWTCKANNFFQLDLSPASPRLAGTGDEVCFYNTETSTFNSIQVANVYNYSDERAKTNVKTIDGGLNTILNLRPVSYTWKSGIGSATRSSHLMTVANGPSCDKNLQFGFLAQELEEVIPDAVKTDEEGRKLINYTAIIPILVKSIQDLQGKVEEQQRMLEYLSKGSVYNSTHKELGHINKCVSDQSSSTLSIDFTLSQQAKDGILLISGIEGVQEKKIELSKFSSSITENISSLNKGVHIATLVINGSVCDSKQFIIE